MSRNVRLKKQHCYLCFELKIDLVKKKAAAYTPHMMLIKRPLERLYDYDSSVSVQVYILSVESFAICFENSNANQAGVGAVFICH